jgi:CRP-like cAMP-binding protein
VRSLALKRAESRLADLLIDLAGAVSEGNQKDQRIVLGYSRRELAEMIGVSTETAIRMLGRLKHEKTIATNRRELVILDADKLARIAHRDDLVAAE